jgi:NAD(P)H-hydrate epimerase
MKILPVEKIREADQYTIANEPVLSVDLMERAATACYKWLRKRIDPARKVRVFCGLGNNGGDGLVIARLLSEDNPNVDVYVIRHSDKCTDDFSVNLDRLKTFMAQRCHDLHPGDPLPLIDPGDVIIDAVFGSGLSKAVTGFPGKIIRHINESRALIVAVDMPSGLFSDKYTDPGAGAIVQADYTLSFQFPKLAFMFAENDRFVGDWKILYIGLHPDFIEKVQTRDKLLTRDMAAGLLKPRAKFSHKGNFGHALLIAGSYGKMGASVMAAKACLRSGVGLLHAHSPLKGCPVMQTAVPEAMVSIDPDESCFSALPPLDPYTAIGIGPGIGFEEKTKKGLKLLIQNAAVPLVLDADALTILGENKTWIPFLPENSVLTPHPKEFERLVGKAGNDFDRQRQLREFCIKHKVYVVLKGAHTCICNPAGMCYFNTTGNPGMASGGSGDVLTGIILGLLAQRYHPGDACLLAVYLHGLAGDLAARKLGMEAIIAGDIIDKIGKAFLKTASIL